MQFVVYLRAIEKSKAKASGKIRPLASIKRDPAAGKRNPWPKAD
jgi:hypothetical protein